MPGYDVRVLSLLSYSPAYRQKYELNAPNTTGTWAPLRRILFMNYRDNPDRRRIGE